MKKIFILVLFGILLVTSSLYSQKEIPDSTLKKIEKCFHDKGEIYFKFRIFMKSELENLTKIISIANVNGNDVYAFANEKEFGKFKELGYDFELLPHPSEEEGKYVNMADNIEMFLGTWDVYPTYEQYITIMNNFATQYPALCRIVDAGNTLNGRKILFAVLSKNVNTTEAEPKFLYTSTMHGNETAGYVFMLRLIDTLLSGYVTNAEFSNLLDNMEIWINPLANPDGTYWGGNNTVTKARRGNANNVDLNRNYPDPLMGNHPDGYSWQPETIIFMNFAAQNYITMSANFHSGVEVVNYPWDHKHTVTADSTWWWYVSRQYADTTHKINSNYMKDYWNGIVRGSEWYIIYGGRQDYMTYFKRSRECTIELNSGSYILAENKLSLYWNYNVRSLINYMKKALYGLTGTVTNSQTMGNIKAKITLNHDSDSSEVFSDSSFGKYYRLLSAGTYTVTASAPGYQAKTISNVVVRNDSTTILNIQLDPYSVPVLIFPLNNSSGQSLNLNFCWREIQLAEKYNFQLSTDSTFINVIVNDTNVVDTTKYVTGLNAYTKYFWRLNALYAGGTGQWSEVWNFRTLQNLTLNLRVYLEGFWKGSFQTHDTVKVYLANSISPFEKVDSSCAMLSTNGTGVFNFTKCINNNYYLAIIHRNHIETWSTLPQIFVTNIPVNYDFTTTQNQAYGNNLVYSNGAWCIYGGDINWDGFIDGSDMAILDNDLYNYISGYVLADINGDEFVDGADMAILDNNLYNYIGVVKPGVLKEDRVIKKQVDLHRQMTR